MFFFVRDHQISWVYESGLKQCVRLGADLAGLFVETGALCSFGAILVCCREGMSWSGRYVQAPEWCAFRCAARFSPLLPTCDRKCPPLQELERCVTLQVLEENRSRGVPDPPLAVDMQVQMYVCTDVWPIDPSSRHLPGLQGVSFAASMRYQVVHSSVC